MSNSPRTSIAKDFSTMTLAELEKERGEEIINLGVVGGTKLTFAAITGATGALIGLSTLATAPLMLACGLMLAAVALAISALNSGLKINENIKKLDERIASKRGPSFAV